MWHAINIIGSLIQWIVICLFESVLIILICTKYMPQNDFEMLERRDLIK